jgi:hypothetical protein
MHSLYDSFLNNLSKKIKPLSLFTRNLTEPHDRGITYLDYITTNISLMSIGFPCVKSHELEQQIKDNLKKIGYDV